MTTKVSPPKRAAQIDIPDTSPDDRGNFFQSPVRLKGALLLVINGKGVDIDQGQGNCLPVALRAIDFPAEDIQKKAMMKEPSQVVPKGYLGLLFVIALTVFNHGIIIPVTGVPGRTNGDRIGHDFSLRRRSSCGKNMIGRPG